jgi:hypothetical protein
MKDIFKNSVEWSVEIKDTTGLPRPHYVVPKEFYDKKNFPFKSTSKFFLHPVVPIPWQSFPIFNDKSKLGLIEKNESVVYLKSLCPYCGVKIEDKEICIIWKDKKIPTLEGPRIWSDYHPFHIECMKQGRKYCPFMRSIKNNQFETGEYKKLKDSVVRYYTDKIENKKDTPKD